MPIKHQSALLNETPTIQHGFYGTEDGVSTGIYNSLNLADYVGDDSASVRENRQIIAHDFDQSLAHLCLLTQIHGTDVLTISAPIPHKPQADAMVTDQPNLILGILTADCVPLLFADSQNNIIGAAHAGWKGALNGIAQNTIDAMCALGAHKTNISVVIGPCIQSDNYEVDQTFHDAFIQKDIMSKTFFKSLPKQGHYRFNLPAYIKAQIEMYHIHNIDQINSDTYPAHTPFFSHRYNTHHHMETGGRQISAICLKNRANSDL